VNRLVIDGVLSHTQPLRYSPAGVPIAEAVLEHRSTTAAARQVVCELAVQASGPLAGQMAGLAAGTQVKLEGALNRRSVNSRQLILIVTDLVLNRIEKE
jgi:primosomal replication protein N